MESLDKNEGRKLREWDIKRMAPDCRGSCVALMVRSINSRIPPDYQIYYSIIFLNTKKIELFFYLKKKKKKFLTLPRSSFFFLTDGNRARPCEPWVGRASRDSPAFSPSCLCVRKRCDFSVNKRWDHVTVPLDSTHKQRTRHLPI